MASLENPSSNESAPMSPTGSMRRTSGICSPHFSGLEGATSLKAEIVAELPKIADSSQFREARAVLHQLGGAMALRDELLFAGFVDSMTDELSVVEKPFNVFAHMASGKLEQPSIRYEQSALGQYQEKFLICANRPENDRHWDSNDPEWIPKASMARRHRFLTTKNLHWQWFNMLVIGAVPPSSGGVSAREALAEVQAMKAAALFFTTNVGNWSENVGLFVNVFGHNNVNSLFVHILDMSEIGPSFAYHAFKNCALDAVIKVLSEEAASEVVSAGPTVPLRETKYLSRRSSQPALPGTGGATSVKEEIITRIPVLKDAAGFREARRLLVQDVGGSQTVFRELVRSGFVEKTTQKLATGTHPLNVFARCAAGNMTQAGMEAEQELLGDYKDFFMACRNRPENDEHWDSEDPEWLGKSSMSKYHRFLTTKDLHWQWFNVLTFGLVSANQGGASKQIALGELLKMQDAAAMYASRMAGWSGNVGLYFHVFGHNSVNSLHLHILDMDNLGPTFWRSEYKNCSIDVIIKVLTEEMLREQGPKQTITTLQSGNTSVYMPTERTATDHAPDMKAFTELMSLNVGGELITVPRGTLELAPGGSFLRKVIENSWSGEPICVDDEDRMFLDFPPRSFKLIVDYFRLLRWTPSNEVLDPPYVPSDLQAEFTTLSWLLGVHEIVHGEPQPGRGKQIQGLKAKPKSVGSAVLFDG